MSLRSGGGGALPQSLKEAFLEVWETLRSELFSVYTFRVVGEVLRPTCWISGYRGGAFRAVSIGVMGLGAIGTAIPAQIMRLLEQPGLWGGLGIGSALVVQAMGILFLFHYPILLDDTFWKASPTLLKKRIPQKGDHTLLRLGRQVDQHWRRRVLKTLLTRESFGVLALLLDDLIQKDQPLPDNQQLWTDLIGCGNAQVRQKTLRLLGRAPKSPNKPTGEEKETS